MDETISFTFFSTCFSISGAVAAAMITRLKSLSLRILILFIALLRVPSSSSGVG
jgi:hypothetical protein